MYSGLNFWSSAGDIISWSLSCTSALRRSFAGDISKIGSPHWLCGCLGKQWTWSWAKPSSSSSIRVVNFLNCLWWSLNWSLNCSNKTCGGPTNAGMKWQYSQTSLWQTSLSLLEWDFSLPQGFHDDFLCFTTLPVDEAFSLWYHHCCCFLSTSPWCNNARKQDHKNLNGTKLFVINVFERSKLSSLTKKQAHEQAH